MKTPFLILVSIIFLGCSNARMHNFQMQKHEIKIDGRTHPQFTKKVHKVFVAPFNSKTSLEDKRFKVFANYVYAALEMQGHKRTYNPKEASLVVQLDYQRVGPVKMVRTGINRLWSNQSPFIEQLFLNTNVNTEAAYEFLKDRRNIQTWKEKNDPFVFHYYVFLTKVRLRAIEFFDNQEPMIVWESKVVSMGQKKRFRSGFIAAIAASMEAWGKNFEKPQYTEIKHTNPNIFRLYEKVVAEVYYNKAKRKQSLSEDYRNLTNDEIIKYYINRDEKYDLNPLYREDFSQNIIRKKKITK